MPESEVTLVFICPRCKRETRGWPLRRPDVCSKKWWVYCIRDPRPEWAIEATTKEADPCVS